MGDSYENFHIFIYAIFSISVLPQSLVEYYVSPDGDDGNTGTTYQDPFVTIDHAFSLISADTNQVYGVNIYILPGEYTQHVTVNRSGRLNYPIKILAFSNEYKPIFYGNDVTIFSGYDAVFRFNDARYFIEIEGLILRNVTANDNMRGIWMQGDHNILKQCEFYTLKRAAIVVQGSYNIIEHNVVDSVIGGSDSTKRGNCISVEGYYYNSIRRNSEFNLIQYNTLINGITHFAINIFPATDDPTQPEMRGNKIYYNFSYNTGGGVYTRYQKDMEIIGNVFVKSVESAYWGSPGGGITFDKHPIYRPYLYYGDTIKIFNNTVANSARYGLKDYNENELWVKNNIFVNNGSSTIDGDGHILFNFTRDSIIAKADYNCYYGTGRWRWGSGSDQDSFPAWRTISLQDSNGMFDDPLFVDTTNNDYSIELHSPAKNTGIALAEVIEDLLGVKRPYWVDGVDIGAYELPDAQFRVGATGLSGNPAIEHSIGAIGTFWEKKDGLWEISSDPDIENSSYTTVGNSPTDREEWDGFHFKWMENSTSQASMGHAFYKVINDYNDAYFYIDLRDAIIFYNPNIYIRFNADIQVQKYQYFDGNTFQNIDNGSILRIWQIKNGTPSTNDLESYWNNVLLMIPDGTHPRLVYGPNTDIGSTNYLIYRKLGAGSYSYFTSTTNLHYTDSQYEFYYGDPPYYVYYKIKGQNWTTQTPYSNEVYNSFHKSQKIIAEKNSIHFENNLLQNYPNPFNPITTIAFNLKNPEYVSLKVYDILGSEIITLVNERLDEGEHIIKFDASHIATGIYFYRITAGKFSAVKKLQLIK